MTRPKAGNEAPEKDGAAELDRLGEMFQHVGAGARIYLYRVHPRPPGSKEDAWLERFDDQAPTFEEVREAYGGGTFRVRLLDGGRRVPGGEAVFAIEGDPIFRGTTIATATAGQAALGADRLDRIVDLVERLARQLDDDDRKEQRRRERMLADLALAREFNKGSADGGVEATFKMARQLMEMIRDASPAGYAGPDTDGEPVPWYAPILARAADALAAPRRAATPPPAPPAPKALPPPAEEPMNLQRVLDDLAQLLADERISAVQLREGFAALPPGMVDSILQAGRESWLQFFTREAQTRPIFATEHAQTVLGELWDLLSAARAA